MWILSKRHADARIDDAGGYHWITGAIVEQNNTHFLDYRSETYRAGSLSFNEAIADAAVWSPIVLLKWLDDHRNAIKYAGQRIDGAVEMNVFNVSLGSEEMTLLVEQGSGRILGLERSYVDYDGSKVLLQLRYFNDKVKDGLRYPTRVELWSHSYLTRHASLAHASYNEPVNTYMKIPPEFALTDGDPENARAFRVKEIADGIFFIGEGAMYQLIVEFDEFLVALDGSSGNVMKRVAAIREKIPAKPFRYVLASNNAIPFRMAGFTGMRNGIALLDAIEARNLDVELIVDPHSPLIATIDDLKKAVKLGRHRHQEIINKAQTKLGAWKTAGARAH